MARHQVRQRLRQHGPAAVLGLALIFGGISVWQAWDIATHLRLQTQETSRFYGEIIAAIGNPGQETPTLFGLSKEAQEIGIPIVVTDPSGTPTAWANTPFDSAGVSLILDNDSELKAYVDQLDRDNEPIVGSGFVVHFGDLPVTRRLTWLGLLQLVILVTAVTIGVWAYRASRDRHRGQIWVAMARESAHQLGTPLMSAGAWVERLGEIEDPRAVEVAKHLTADLERLERVAKRFERIGRPARRDRVSLGVLVERVAAYFEPRLPRHAHQIELRVEAPDAGPMIQADRVLVEWALEALVRNSIDALSSRGGLITVGVKSDGDKVLVSVTDDGPGVPLEVRSNLFEPGVTTKQGGWGIGLALARRVIEEVHGGYIDLLASDTGATFVVSLPVTGQDADD